MKRVLVISPHPDDAELWAGATLWKMRNEWDVENLVLTHLGGDNGGRFDEAVDASEILGIGVGGYDFPDTHLPEHRQEITKALVNFAETESPDLVICPNSTDLHQDHRVVYEICWRIFRRDCSILGYDVPYNSPTPRNQMYSVVRKDDMLQKEAALKCYKSQADKAYMQPWAYWALAHARGAEVNADFAECFEVIRWRV